AKHRFNPPACPNANADVESVHATIETELFDAQVFHSRSDFFAKLSTYQLCYNAARKNSSRAYKSPADLLAIKAPHLSPKIFLLHPIHLESLLPHKGGHDVPRLPAARMCLLDLLPAFRLTAREPDEHLTFFVYGPELLSS
ncbi:MAG: hypothetical protein EXS23_00790, partial [Pedosphaera sp.]|nr:hypothetical protein [Pedosphaera sp.]